MKNKGISTFLVCAAVFCWFTVLVPGCKKPTDEIGSDIGVVDGNINSAFLDTFQMYAATVREDSVRADRIPVVPFGSFFDPYFGITTGSMYVNFNLSNTFPSGMPAITQVDSVILRVRYGSPTHFGDIGKYKGPIKITAYRLMDKLTVYPDTGSVGYWSSRSFNIGSTPVGSGLVIANPYDSVKVDGVNEAAHLRLKLDNSFGMTVLTENPMGFASTTAFDDYFRGLYLRVAPAANFGDGGFAYLSPATAGSRLTFYYNGGQKLDVRVNVDKSVWVGHYEHNYSVAVPPFQNLTTASGEQNMLVQPLGGSRIKLYLPYIKNFNADKSLGINKAELVFPVDPALLGNYPPSEQLLLARYDASAGKLYRLADDIQTSGANGGTYDANRKEYKFTVTLHLQSVLKGLVNNDTLIVEMSRKGTRGNRAPIYGTQNPLNRTRLRIYYTKLQ